MKNYRCKKCLYHFCSENRIPYCPACDCEDLEELSEETDVDVVLELESHHIHPRFMNNREDKGQQYNIPKKKHHILHGKIMKWIWEEVDNKDKAINNIINKSKNFLVFR